MFYKLIEKKRNEWLSSPDCKVRDLLSYIEQQGKMRDAQIEAIKTFLFLKLACQNKPLWQLFCEGTFNSLDLNPLEISHIARQVLKVHQPLTDLWGLVAVTNAEKVILDKRIPSLSIYIDEVHHASDSDIKLRQVVNEWTESQHFNSVLGFSGTPYLKTAESVTLGGDFAIRNTDLSNVVYKAKNWSFYEGRYVPKKRTAMDGKVWWCAYDTVDGCCSKSLYHGKYKTKRSCEIGINWSIKEYNRIY